MKGFIIIGLMLCCTGCTSMIEKGGTVLDGSIFAEKTAATYQVLSAGGGKSAVEVKRIKVKKEDQESLVITMAAFPALEFRGTLPAQDGSFQLQSMHCIVGNLWGWNEFALEVIGGGVFTMQGDLGIFEAGPSIELVQIISGKIRNKGNRLIGEQALTSLRNRYDRITALTGWMHTLQDVPRFETQEDFENYWKPLLLPELVTAGKRPSAFSKKQAVWVRAEDIRWNTSYTEFLLPEELWVLRNSGALVRDWEEASGWIYMHYQWDCIVEIISDRYTLIKVK